jgi:pyrimidine operon attenuation protein/uracil phosphoribosyltransferase
MDFGRPSSIQVVTLIDRGHRELPIQPDYTGLKLNTLSSETVRVHLKEADGKDEVVVVK